MTIVIPLLCAVSSPARRTIPPHANQKFYVVVAGFGRLPLVREWLRVIPSSAAYAGASRLREIHGYLVCPWLYAYFGRQGGA